MSALPPPPVPPDADLKHMPSLMIDIDRLINSTQAARYSAEVNWYAMVCWLASIHQIPAGSLPDDDVELAYLVRLGTDKVAVRRWAKLRAAGALRKWEKHSDGRLYHPIVTEKVQDLLKKSRAAKKAVSEREAKKTGQVIDNQQTQEIERSSNDHRTIINRREGKGIEENIDITDKPISPNHMGVSTNGVAQIFDFGAETPAPTKPKADPVLIEKAWAAFWRRYPSRAPASNPSVPAKDKFTKLMKAAPDPKAWADEVIASVEVFAKIEKDAGTEGRNIAQAVTWLNQQRWKDYRAMPQRRDDGMC